MQRRISLHGCVNFRDLGGYPAGGGKAVKWGKLYRSDSLARLTPADFDALARHGIRTVCDFRSDLERAKSPTVWSGAAPKIVVLPIGPDPSEAPIREVLLKDPGAEPLRRYMLRAYTALPFLAAPHYREAFRLIRNGSLPVLVHCTVGKDRTGLFTAFLLTALGVPRETVFADYLLSNEYILGSELYREAVRGAQEQFGAGVIRDDTLKPVLGVEPAYLEAAFEAIGKRYPSFESYADSELGISAADVEQLRAELIE